MNIFSKLFGRSASVDDIAEPAARAEKKINKTEVMRNGDYVAAALRKEGLMPVASYHKAEVTSRGALPESMVLSFKHKSGTMATIEVFRQKATYELMDKSTKKASSTPDAIIRLVVAMERSAEPVLKY